MHRFAFVIVLALALGGCGDDEEPASPASASVCDAVEGRAPETALALRGSPIQLNDLGAAAHPGSVSGFVLVADGCSIFVAVPDRSSVPGVERRETLTVNGIVRNLEDGEAKRLRRILDLPNGAEAIQDGVPSPTPIGPGDPFVDGFSLTGESTAG